MFLLDDFKFPEFVEAGQDQWNDSRQSSRNNSKESHNRPVTISGSVDIDECGEKSSTCIKASQSKTISIPFEVGEKHAMESSVLQE